MLYRHLIYRKFRSWVFTLRKCAQSPENIISKEKTRGPPLPCTMNKGKTLGFHPVNRDSVLWEHHQIKRRHTELPLSHAENPAARTNRLPVTVATHMVLMSASRRKQNNICKMPSEAASSPHPLEHTIGQSHTLKVLMWISLGDHKPCIYKASCPVLMEFSPTEPSRSHRTTLKFPPQHLGTRYSEFSGSST